MSICSISVSPKYILLKKGENYLNQTVKVDGDTTTSCLEWCSEDPSIAGVHPDSGRILANGVGKTKVYVNSIFDTTKKDYIEVEVTDGAICVQSIELSTTSVTIEKGDTFELSATVSPYNATNKSINWSSSNTNVATVNNGVVTAKAKGWTFIYARANDCSEVEAMCFVEVTEDVLVTSVTVSWSKDEVVLNKNLTVGKVAYASKTVCPCDATDKTVTWISDDERVAIVNRDSGLVTAKAVGEATIRATAKDGSGVYGECTVTVVPPIHVTGIRTCTNKCLNVGEIECLCTTVLPENATNKTVRYSSSNPNVATVELFTGIITPKRAGTTTITATTDDGGFTASCTVKVNQVLSYPDNLITNTSTRNAILKLKNMQDEAVNAYLNGTISCVALQKAIERINYEINLARADYIAVGTNPLSDYAYAILGGDKSATIPYSFKRNLYYRPDNPFTGLDVMVVQRVLELYGYYDHDSDSLYGTWDQETQNAALSWMPLLSVIGGERVFDNASFHVLFQSSNVSQRTYESMRLLQQFNLQHKEVQIKCMQSLLKSGTLSRIEMPIKGGSFTGGTGRADVVGKTVGGTYVWEVKHNTASAITAGDAQVQRYISASQIELDQDAFYPNDLKSEYKLPLIAGPSIFAPTAIPWYGKYLLYKSYVSTNPYRNALVVYEESETLPDNYVFVEEPLPVEVPEPELGSAFDFTSVYDILTNYGEGIVTGMQIDPQTGAILIEVFVLGVMCLISLAALLATA